MIPFVIFSIIFYFLSVIQNSFLVHFSVCNRTPNFILLAIVIYNLIEKRENKTGTYIALTGGFFLDVFSDHFIGLNMAILLVISLVIKTVVKNYVRIPLSEEN